MRIYPGQAERAIHTHIATPLGMSVLQAAAGLYRIVNANMAGAARLVSVAKGYDPRDFALLALWQVVGRCQPLPRSWRSWGWCHAILA